MAKSTKGRSRKSRRQTSRGSPTATSSRGSAGGRKPSNSRAGRWKDRSGQVRFPVSRFRTREREEALPIEDTAGPLFSLSSKSADLQYGLESRLRALLAVNGSAECDMTWKLLDMPAQGQICQLQPLIRRTSGREFTWWPTPTGDMRQGAFTYRGMKLCEAAALAMTPNYEWQSLEHFRRLRDYSVAISKFGDYNPDLSRWLMGFPEGWFA